MKMNGTVICVDTSKERGDTFVKSLNDSNHDIRAHFYECDVRKKEDLLQVIHAVTKDIGDISILLNCSSSSIVATYYDVSSF